ncbi:hypothetical protein E2C01_012700 [Portunus trituberculatus]|uniref:Uncharacterized protein n=1 Tax=Portunus trituberculatus TaxID=210409 RepID=A0A5B7DEU4_PORTR|nr:hypothetical protein [Portunus trituberculatus]
MIDSCSPDHTASLFHHRQHGKFNEENQPYCCCRV